MKISRYLRHLANRLLSRNAAGPTVSVIVPFFASHGQLSRCLSSITSHSSLDHEILVIDDGNGDFDFSDVAQHPHTRVIHLSRNMGPGAARNAGIKEAAGQYILFMDSDDELVADPAQYLAAAGGLGLTQLPDVITGQLESPGTAQKRRVRATNMAEDSQVIKLASFTAHLYRSDFLRRISACFPTDLRTAEDTVFLARVLPYADCIVTTGIACYRYHTTDGSLSRRQVSHANFHQRFGQAAPLIAEALAPFPKAQAARCSMLFKFAVMTLKKNAASFDTADRDRATGTLAWFARAIDLTSPEAVAARSDTRVYWDEKFDRCLTLVAEADAEGLFSYIESQDIRAFKG